MHMQHGGNGGLGAASGSLSSAVNSTPGFGTIGSLLLSGASGGSGFIGGTAYIGGVGGGSGGGVGPGANYSSSDNTTAKNGLPDQFPGGGGSSGLNGGSGGQGGSGVVILEW